MTEFNFKDVLILSVPGRGLWVAGWEWCSILRELVCNSVQWRRKVASILSGIGHHHCSINILLCILGRVAYVPSREIYIFLVV